MDCFYNKITFENIYYTNKEDRHRPVADILTRTVYAGRHCHSRKSSGCSSHPERDYASPFPALKGAMVRSSGWLGIWILPKVCSYL